MDRTPDTLRPGQVSAWLEALQDMPYETGRLAVTRVIRTWTSPRFPAPGALEAAAREITREGIPNAGAYSQDGLGPRYDMNRIRRALEPPVVLLKGPANAVHVIPGPPSVLRVGAGVGYALARYLASGSLQSARRREPMACPRAYNTSDSQAP